MKCTVKDGAGIVWHNGKPYGPGEKLDVTETEALAMAHALKEGDDLQTKAAKPPKG